MNPLDELQALTSLFADERPLIAQAEHVPAAALPQSYRKMLAHEHHMTVTMEEYYGCPVEVRVVDRRLDGDIYSRRSILVESKGRKEVQFGVVRFDLRYVTQPVREEILDGEVPLGRVLINHNVLRHLDVGALLRIQAGPLLSEHLAVPEGSVTFGRLATIFCNQRPAVDLLEIPAPLA